MEATCSGCDNPLVELMVPKNAILGFLRGQNILVIGVPDYEDPDEYVDAALEQIADDLVGDLFGTTKHKARSKHGAGKIRKRENAEG